MAGISGIPTWPTLVCNSEGAIFTINTVDAGLYPKWGCPGVGAD